MRSHRESVSPALDAFVAALSRPASRRSVPERPRGARGAAGDPMTEPGIDQLAAALADRYLVEEEMGAGRQRHGLPGPRPAARPLGRAQGAPLRAGRGARASSGSSGRSAPRPGCTIPTSCRCSTPACAAGRLFYTMPYVATGSLRDRLRTPRAAAGGGRWCSWRGRWRRRWATPTRSASSTATSSPRTFCSPSPATRCSATSASPTRWTSEHGDHSAPG